MFFITKKNDFGECALIGSWLYGIIITSRTWLPHFIFFRHTIIDAIIPIFLVY